MVTCSAIFSLKTAFCACPSCMGGTSSLSVGGALPSVADPSLLWVCGGGHPWVGAPPVPGHCWLWVLGDHFVCGW